MARKMDPDIQELVAATKRKPADGLKDVLAKLTECLGQKSLQDDEYLEKFKQDLFNNGILNYCANALRLNFSKVNEGIKTAVRLADIISACCVGVGDVNNTDSFRNKFLLLVANNMLFLSDSLMKKALRVKSDGERTRLFRRVMDSLSWVLRDHHHLIPHVIDSEHFENIQLCEDEDVAEILLALWVDLFSTKSSNIIVDIGDEALNVILDDLMFKMSNFQNPVIGRSAVKILMHIINHDNTMLQVILTRYRGLAEMVVKDWRGKGFDPMLDRLVGLLKLPPPSRHTDAKGVSAERVRAACVIQAAWRAHKTRRRLRKLPRVITRLQRSFRERKRREEECVERRRAEEELRLQLQLRRQTANRLFRQRQLNLMEQLPADQVHVYLGEVERRAAMLIQRVWRGHRERRSFQRRRYHLQRHRAANTIQRAVLRFLERCRAQKAKAAPWRGFKKITDERREELQKEIDEYLYIHSKHGVSEQRCREVHNSTQLLLRDWLKSRQEAEKQQQHTQALLAQINTDMELLLNAPSLKDSTSSDCSVFRSRCGPVAARGRQCHSAMTRAASLPWWQRLTWDALNADLFHADAHGHHADDPDDAFADDGWELPTLYRGGIRRHDNGNDGVPPPPLSVPRLLYPGRAEDDTDAQDGATRSRTPSPYPDGITRHDRDIQQAQLYPGGITRHDRGIQAQLYPGGIRHNIDTQTSMAQLYRGSVRDAQDRMTQLYPGGIRDTQDRMAQREVAQPYYGEGMQRSTDMAWQAGTHGIMAAHRPMPTAQYQGEEGALRHDMGDTANALIRRLRQSVTTQETY